MNDLTRFALNFAIYALVIGLGAAGAFYDYTIAANFFTAFCVYVLFSSLMMAISAGGRPGETIDDLESKLGSIWGHWTNRWFCNAAGLVCIGIAVAEGWFWSAGFFTVGSFLEKSAKYRLDRFKNNPSIGDVARKIANNTDLSPPVSKR